MVFISINSICSEGYNFIVMSINKKPRHFLYHKIDITPNKYKQTF